MVRKFNELTNFTTVDVFLISKKKINKRQIKRTNFHFFFLMSQFFWIEGRPKIDPFYNQQSNNPIDDGGLRQFVQMNEHPYNLSRKRWNQFSHYYHQNPNYQYPIIYGGSHISLANPKNGIFQDKGDSFPTGISNQLHIAPSPSCREPRRSMSFS